MDDRNLVAVAEQAACTSRIRRGVREGATIQAEDGRVFLGCRLEFSDPDLDQDAIANGLAAGRVAGMRRVARIGFYSPVEKGLPGIPQNTLRRLKELAVPGFAVILSSGRGEREEKSLQELLSSEESPV